jgi:ribosomal protein L19E
VDLDEMIKILEEIARDKRNRNAQVSAIRALRQLAELEEEGEIPQTAFDDLDAELKNSEWRKRHGRDN